MLRCNIWLSSVDVNIESVASGGKLNLLSSYESDMNCLSDNIYFILFKSIFSVTFSSDERVGTHITQIFMFIYCIPNFKPF